MHLNNLGVQTKNAKLSSIKMRLYLAMLVDVDVDNFPKAELSTISSNVLLAGRKHFYVDAKINTINPTGSPGESQGTVGLVLSPQIEGISKVSLDWIYKINGERVVAFWENCETKEKFIAGSPCSGGLLVSIQSLGKMEDGFNGAILNLTGDPCPEPFYFYEGPIILEDPQTVPADAATFALTEKVQYLLSENTEANELTGITGASDSQVGRIIELIGAGNAYPTTIAAGSTFILKNGLSWPASSGSRLSLQIVKTGANTYAFYEVARS
ncbi:MAG: hypothetical protein LBI65_02100 [Candidatus Symbiothrix sp.]|jgi:hypothetical protein|nr:hypothetical protein [Candidatus Symbiothrix sp.]